MCRQGKTGDEPCARGLSEGCAGCESLGEVELGLALMQGAELCEEEEIDLWAMAVGFTEPPVGTSGQRAGKGVSEDTERR